MSVQRRILVCVTQQVTCERLIRKAAVMTENAEEALFVIHVTQNHYNFLNNDKEGEALEYLFGISKSVGADLTVLKSDNIIDTITEFAKEHRIDSVIIGESSPDDMENGFYNALRECLGSWIEILIIPQEDD